MRTRITTLVLAALPASAIAQPFAITAASLSCGGSTTPAAAGQFTLTSVIGDPLARNAGAAGLYTISAGFLAVTSGGGPPPCYANCDASTLAPLLNVNDFSCFLNRYAAGNPYANCDASTLAPLLNVNDFSCFLNRYAAGCP